MASTFTRSVPCTRNAAPILGLAALAALGMAAAPAQAQTTISFNNFTAPSQARGQYDVGLTYDTQGFTFNSNGQQFFALNGTGKLGDGETSLYSNNGGSTTLTQDNGQTFSLNAIDLGPYAGNSEGTIFDGATAFTGTLANGTTVTATETTSNPNGQFQTFDFTGFTNLTSLTFTPQNGSTTIFDNVVLTPAAVPEASTTLSFGLLLVLGGLGLCVCKRTAASGSSTQ